MTRQAHLKRRIRERMSKTGERYTTARRYVLHRDTRDGDPSPAGLHPETAALRVVLEASGAFAFHYEEENFSSFYLTGRHQWQDGLTIIRLACDHLGLTVALAETGGAKAAERQLRDLLTRGPAIVWVDLSHLPYRAVPDFYSGGYHVIVVQAVDESAGVARVGDLADEWSISCSQT